ncbi:MAG: DMT family transporter [Candidatus Puniceispirillum sp.]
MRLTNLIPLIFVWLWSTGFVGAKYGLPYIEPFFMLFVRFVCVIVLFLLIIEIGRHRRATWRQAIGQMFVGLMLHGLYLGGVFYAIKQGIPAGISAVIVGLQPILLSVLERVFLRQPGRSSAHYRRQYIGLITGFIGVTLVVTGNGISGTGITGLTGTGIAGLSLPDMSIIGLIANVIALFGIAIGTVIQKRIGGDVPLLSGSLYQYLGAMILMLVLTFTLETQAVTPTFELALAMLWLVFGLSLLAVVLLMYMIREGEVVKVTSYFYLVPPVTLIQTWLLFDERLNAVALAGCALTVYAVYKVVRAPTTST